MRLHSDDFETTDDGNTRDERRNPSSFGQRHALKIMGGIMAILFATVLVAQVAC